MAVTITPVKKKITGNAAAAIVKRIAPQTPIEKIEALRQWVNRSVTGRADLIEALILGIVARQNVTLLGVPGTAKTYAVRKVAEAFADKPGDVFDLLLTKFTKPVEVLGPVDLDELKRGNYKYATAGYLPAAKVGVLDELYKGSSAILNALLQLANERTFRDGNTTVTTPLRMLVGMSNEFPEDPALLAAFFDRFPIKLMVQSLDSTGFRDMIENAGVDHGKCPIKLTDADLDEIDSEVADVLVPPDLFDAVAEVREILDKRGVKISDRRWVQAMRLMKAHAWMHGRSEADRSDMAVLELVAWNNANEIGVIKGVLPDFQRPFERQLREMVDEVCEERRRIVAAVTGPDPTAKPDMKVLTQEAAKAMARIKHLSERITGVIEAHVQSDDDKALADQAKRSIESVLAAVRSITLGKAGVDELRATEKFDMA